MREQNADPSDDISVDGEGPLGRSPMSNAHQSNGFTAVNGDSQSNNAFRPDHSAKEHVPSQPNDNGPSRYATHINTSFHTHGWRPDERSTREESDVLRVASAPRKRKRSISVNVDNPETEVGPMTETEGRELAKRRAASTLDSAIDLTSPATTLHSAVPPSDRRQHHPSPIGPYARERSPVARWNRSDPPPKPRPEISAQLAESVNKFHQTQQSQGSQQGGPAADRRQSSPANGTDQQDANASDDEDTHGDSTGTKKDNGRKRNFSNRTKTGCHTCRGRKKKCDEAKPICGNCARGNFSCAGYGPKPPNGSKVVSLRHLHVQPKGYDHPSAPGAYYGSPSDEPGLSYSHWGRVPASELPPGDQGRPYSDPHAAEQRYAPPSRDGWHRPGWPPSQSTPSHFGDRFPPPDHPHGHQYHYSSSHPSLPPPQHPAPPPLSDPFAQYGAVEPYPRNSARAPTVASSRSGSNPTHSSSQQQNTAHLALALSGFQPSEKDKMLRGQPFLHWLDNVLIGERDSCAIAVACYNKGARSDKGLSRDAKQNLFAQILDPGKRIHGGQRAAPASALPQSPSPVGSVGNHTIVESPFKCDYGYNIHLGNATVLQAGCHLQDAADIVIGDRVIVGPDVRIYCLTASVDCGSRRGSQGAVVAGAVLIEDDVFIGAGAIILPYCTVGRGAVVGAGSVVTRDVKENTVVAGNPAKFIRSISPGGGGEGQADRRHAYEIQERNERVKKRMVEYANSGFNRYSPRLI